MTARHNTPRAALGRPATLHGVVPGGTEHRILLALRGVGGMTSEQVCARFGSHQGGALHRLKRAGLLELPPLGERSQPIKLTDIARALTDADGPLCRAKNLTTYCQL